MMRFLMLFTLAFFSCSKKKGEKFSVAGKWKDAGVFYSDGSWYPPRSCNEDDIYIFSEDGNYTQDMSDSLCSPNEFDYHYPYRISNDTIYLRDYPQKITMLTPNELRLSGRHPTGILRTIALRKIN